MVQHVRSGMTTSPLTLNHLNFPLFSLTFPPDFLTNIDVFPDLGRTRIFVKYFIEMTEATGEISIVLTWILLWRHPRQLKEIKEIWFTWPPRSVQRWEELDFNHSKQRMGENISTIFYNSTKLFPLLSNKRDKLAASDCYFPYFLQPPGPLLK